MEFKCPSCREITENEFINKVYDEMKYQCLGCRKEWKIIFVDESKKKNIFDYNIVQSTIINSFNPMESSKTFQRNHHEIYTHPDYKYFCRHCGLRGYDSTHFMFNKIDCIYPNDYDVDMFKENNNGTI